MKLMLSLVLLALTGMSTAQFHAGMNRPSYGKPPMGNPGPPPFPGYHARPEPAFDDPIPPMEGQSSYENQKLPSELPILAPNGVVEIYNRVVDDLIRNLARDMQQKEMDPMPVVVRPTPPGPVRVPGYLQKRPFRRPGAPLYRAADFSSDRVARAGILPPETRFPKNERPLSNDNEGSKISSRGEGKITKDPAELVDDELEDANTMSIQLGKIKKKEKEPQDLSKDSSESSSEESYFLKSRNSDELFPIFSDEIFDGQSTETDATSNKKSKVSKIPSASNERSDVDNLMMRYQNQNLGSSDIPTSGESTSKSKKHNEHKPVVVDPFEDEKEEYGFSLSPNKYEEKDKEKKKLYTKHSSEEDSSSASGSSQENDFGYEPGTGGGERPLGGYYPPDGPPVVPRKPNAFLKGLSKIRRASDVTVRVDARSALATARLLVGPITVHINDSSEPLEKDVRATIPELEAEVILMERHGVVFLKRFTLDRAYGQDVEISIPKSKTTKHKYKDSPVSNDPNHPANMEARRQTKMAAHVSMEVVKLLRSGNLRVNLVRMAQSSMDKLSLPIKKSKPKRKRTKGSKYKKRNKKGRKGSKNRNKNN